MKTIRIECEAADLVDPAKLKIIQGNLKSLSVENYEKLRAEIDLHGFSFAIHVWKNPKKELCVLDGTQRTLTVLRMRLDGWSCPKVPINYVKAKSLKEAVLKLLGAASQYGKVDKQGLYELMSLVEITMVEIKNTEIVDQKKFEDEFFVDREDEDQEDELPTPPKVAITKPGDLWLLGDHRVLCGNATQIDTVAKLMNGKRARLVFTDPPYDPPYNLASDSGLSRSSALQELRPGSYGKLSDSEWDKNFDITQVFPSLDYCAGPDAAIYVCTSSFLFGKIETWLHTLFDSANYCVWAKSNPMPSLAKRHWTHQTELIAYGTRGKHRFNFPDKGHAPNVWYVAKNQKNDLHPTQKPVAVPEHAIRHSSQRGDLVVDLFLGSGSTLIAADKLGRTCYGTEIDPLYCDVIVARWEKLTGLKAVLAKA